VSPYAVADAYLFAPAPHPLLTKLEFFLDHAPSSTVHIQRPLFAYGVVSPNIPVAVLQDKKKKPSNPSWY